MGPVRIGFYDTALSVNSQMSFVCSEVLYVPRWRPFT
jgi:hypothetical protein